MDRTQPTKNWKISTQRDPTYGSTQPVDKPGLRCSVIWQFIPIISCSICEIMFSDWKEITRIGGPSSAHMAYHSAYCRRMFQIFPTPDECWLSFVSCGRQQSSWQGVVSDVSTTADLYYHTHSGVSGVFWVQKEWCAPPNSGEAVAGGPGRPGPENEMLCSCNNGVNAVMHKRVGKQTCHIHFCCC